MSALRVSAGRAARLALVRRARADVSVFVDGLYGFRSAPFQREWHRLALEHDRLVIWAPVEHGKSYQFIGHTIWQLGRNPKLHGLIVGQSAGAAIKLLSAIRRLIDESPWVRAVFPHLRPAVGKYARWTDDAIRVAGQDPGDKDYTLQAIGYGGGILGARLDWVLADDVCTFETTATAGLRQKVREWWSSTITGRLLPSARVVMLGNAWFPDDVMHWLVKHAGYTASRMEAYRETVQGQVIPDSILWPERWPLDRLNAKIVEFGTKIEAQRQLRCIAYASGSSHFDLAWFDAAFERGEQDWPSVFGLQQSRFLTTYRGTWGVYTGVDLGVSRKPGRDKTSIFTIAVNPENGRRYPIYAERGQWTGPEIIRRLRDIHARFGGRVVVENNAAQDFLLQWTREKGIAVESITTGMQKLDPRFGVPSIATELEQGLWALPEELLMHEWRAACLAFDPSQHTGDILMASWFAREACRTSLIATSGQVEPTGLRGGYRLRGRYDVAARRSMRRVA